jgi:hypothetical protein
MAGKTITEIHGELSIRPDFDNSCHERALVVIRR